MRPAPDTIWPKQVVYEDNHLLVVNKLPSEIVQGDKTGDLPLSEKVKSFIKNRDRKPGNVFCGVIHRLDRPVSGMVMFAKTGKGLSRFNELIRERGVRKRYLAVVKQKPQTDNRRLVHFLVKNEKSNVSRAHDNEVNGSLRAELQYKVLASSDNYHLLGIDLITGRHHQIRCQLAAIGSPIKGDLKYGFPRSNSDGSIHLHSYSLEFTHPVRSEPVSLTCWPLQEDPVWRYFEKAPMPEF